MSRYLNIIAVILMINVIGNAAARSKNAKMPSQPIKLYYLPPSPPCRAVMMTAKALGLELDLVLTNIMEGQHMTPEYLKMNPQHTVPTMDDNGFILWESRAIMAYLVNAYGRDDTLYPKNPRIRALVDQRLYFDAGTLFLRYSNVYVVMLNATKSEEGTIVSLRHLPPAEMNGIVGTILFILPFITPLGVNAWEGILLHQRYLYTSHRRLPMLFRGAEMNNEQAEKLDEALEWLNKALEGRTYVAGDDLTIADISIVVTITNLDAFGYDMSSYDNILGWFARTKKTLEPYGYKEIDRAGGEILNAFLKKH